MPVKSNKNPIPYIEDQVDYEIRTGVWDHLLEIPARFTEYPFVVESTPHGNEEWHQACKHLIEQSKIRKEEE